MSGSVENGDEAAAAVGSVLACVHVGGGSGGWLRSAALATFMHSAQSGKTAMEPLCGVISRQNHAVRRYFARFLLVWQLDAAALDECCMGAYAHRGARFAAV